MQVTFKACPKLVKVGEIGESIVEDDEALRGQLTNFVLTAIYDRTIPLRTKAGFKASTHAMDHAAKAASRISQTKTKEELVRFEAGIRAEALKGFADETERRAAKRRAAREAGMQAIAQPPETPILNPEDIMQTPLLKALREKHADFLAESEPLEARGWAQERFRKGFVLLSEVADWLRKEQGFDVTIVDPSIPTDGELARMLAKWFEKPIGAIPQRLRAIAEAYIPKWPELSSAERRARANEVDRQLATKLALKIRQADREKEQAKNDPKQVAEGIVAWYDMALDAMTWWGLGSITPHEAAMLLCHFNPQNDAPDPLEITTKETTPDDFKRILRVFEDVSHSQPKDRRLSEWHDIAHDKSLKYHSWIDAYRQAMAEIDEAKNLRKADSTAAVGLSKRVIISVDWPLPGSSPTLKNILDELPKWVESACLKVGRPGKGSDGSHLWNPAVLAICLATKTPQKKWAVGKGTLTNFLSLHFHEYLAEWTEKSEYL